MDELLKWINHFNETTYVKIEKTTLSKQKSWYYDTEFGCIRNENNSFFQITGVKGYVNNEFIEQPIIIQDEIGYLGIICKDFNGETKYLMQAKIEPGNINCVQISPTIQATKSNFLKKHGGNEPLYFEYFLNAQKYSIIADQIHSEQSSRFYKKRNRNMIIKVKEDIYCHDRFRWMSLIELKELMKYDNIVNMDTRSVLSCLPIISPDFVLKNKIYSSFMKRNIEFYNSVQSQDYIEEIIAIYYQMNNYKMFNRCTSKLVPLDELDSWEISDSEIVCKNNYPFKVIFCKIEIEGREVTQWAQPLLQANGCALFCLIKTTVKNETKYLVKLTPEIGCFDFVEIGPTIQKEYGQKYNNEIEKLFETNLKSGKGIVFDSVLSEEGGRFYHEENRNIVMNIDFDEIPKISDEYIWVSYRTLNHLNLINNCLNIQLRNLLSTLEVE